MDRRIDAIMRLPKFMLRRSDVPLWCDLECPHCGGTVRVWEADYNSKFGDEVIIPCMFCFRYSRRPGVTKRSHVRGLLIHLDIEKRANRRWGKPQP